MTIYIICPKLSGRGGIETVLTTVIKRLSENKINVVLYIQNHPQHTKWIDGLKNNNVRVIYGNKFSHLLIVTYLFISAGRESRFLIASTSRISLLGFFIKKMLGKKWLLFHWLHFSLNISHNYNYLNKCDGILAISSSIAQQLSHFNIDRRKIYLIYNPCVIDQGSNLITSDKQKRFTYIGRLEDKQKNVSELLRALSLINNKNMILDIYGDGKDKGKYKALSQKLKIDNIVIWHGWKDSIWKTIKNKPNALILPSRFEGFPMILLEAMSRGIPCITSDFLGYKDIIVERRNGVHYHLGHPEELAEILDRFDDISFSSQVIKDSIVKFNQEEYFKRLNKAIQI